MNRLFTKDATGIAPNGRLFAGDINALQDAVAAIMDFAQVLGLGTLEVGDASIQLLKYAAGEARLSAALRTDGILRGLGGMFAGTFTTAQRDAIPAGSRPYGLIILNTTTNRLEWNGGTDAAPSWQAVGLNGAGSPAVQAVPTGALFDWPATAAPTGYLLCDGSAVSRTTYAALYAALGGAASPYGQGDNSTTFNLPDFRGRVAVGKNTGTFAALGAKGGEETHVLLLAESPAHDHGGATSSLSAGTPAGTINSVSAGTPAGTISADSAGTPAGTVTVAGSGTLTTGVDSPAHTHGYTAPTAPAAHHHTYYDYDQPGGVSANTGDFNAVLSTSPVQSQGNFNNHTHSLASHAHTATFAGTALGTHSHTFTGAALAGHSHSFTGAALAAHSHTITSQGGDAAHNNLQPYLVVNKIIKT